jgi:hypothetical protein
LISPSKVDSKPALPLELQPAVVAVGGTIVAVGGAVVAVGWSVPGPTVSVGGAIDAVHDGGGVCVGGAAVRVRVGVRLGVRVHVGTRVWVELGRTV